MEKTIERAVGRVIETMRHNLGEQLTVDDMARLAMFSKFHFSRVFQRVTGVTPGRFLSAVRLQEAKQLLVSTSLTVTDISHRVGYTSVGTFSSRFRTSVGVSPTTYRQLGGFTPAPVPDVVHRGGDQRAATIRGTIRSEGDDELGLVFVGLFADRVPQGQPVRCTVLHRLGTYVLEEVPKGTWYLIAHSVAVGLEEAVHGPSQLEQSLRVGFQGPIRIRPDAVTQAVDVTHRVDLQLRPLQPVDPPVLPALLRIRAAALSASGA